MKFSDQYKHPKWQQKRMEVFENVKSLHDVLCCQRCFDTEVQLQVHHKRYVKDKMIWEYPISELELLCSQCHEEAHEDKDELQNIIALLPTEAIPEITSIITGYCQYIASPAAIRFPENPNMYYSEFCGKIAGSLANKMNMDGLFELLQKIEEASCGDEITFTIPKFRGLS